MVMARRIYINGVCADADIIYRALSRATPMKYTPTIQPSHYVNDAAFTCVDTYGLKVNS